MIAAPLPPNEVNRLAALHDLDVLDSGSEDGFDLVVGLAGKLLDVPIALVSLVDETRQWFKARQGLDVSETPRELAFCAHTILHDDVMVVVDASEDPRFFRNPLVLNDPEIRAYAGAPIVVDGGYQIGTVCAIDRRPRSFSPDQLDILRQLAKMVSQGLSLRKLAREQLQARAKMEEAQRLSNRASVLIETMSDGVVLHDRSGAVIQANASACHLLGLSLDQLLGVESMDPRWRAFSEAMTPIRGEDHPAMVALRTGKPVTDFVMGLDLSDLGVRWLRISANPLFELDDAKPSHALVTFGDVTALKAQEQDLRRLGAKAQAASHAKSAFIANMSHEIRTPLNGVVGVAGALARTKLDPRQQEMVGLIQSSGRTLERLLSDVLDLSKIETGQMELELATIRLVEVVESAANLMRERAEEAGVGFKIDYAPGLKREYLGDGVRLRQVISNLVSNAVKFTAKGEVRVCVRPLAPVGIEVEISDTGIGFDDAFKEGLFSRFSQADSSITRRFGGSGLGLAITKALVELMNGEIEAHGQPGTGAVFKFRLPLADCDERPSNPDPNEGANLSTLPVDLNILVAEDSAMNRRVIQLMLEPLGLSASFVENGLQAVHAVEAQSFDLILMDMQMPEMDGLTAIMEIRKREMRVGATRTRVIMLTANATEDHRRQAIAAGADLHLSKPVTIESLHWAIGQCLFSRDQIAS